MNNNIPQEVKDKMNEAVKAICEHSTGYWDDIATEGLEAGYSLALPEIAALKAEVERLKGMVEQAHDHGYKHVDSFSITTSWEHFKDLNNL